MKSGGRNRETVENSQDAAVRRCCRVIEDPLPHREGRRNPGRFCCTDTLLIVFPRPAVEFYEGAGFHARRRIAAGRGLRRPSPVCAGPAEAASLLQGPGHAEFPGSSLRPSALSVKPPVFMFSIPGDVGLFAKRLLKRPDPIRAALSVSGIVTDSPLLIPPLSGYSDRMKGASPIRRGGISPDPLQKGGCTVMSA